MFRIPSIADASAQQPPFAPKHSCVPAPTGSTYPVAVEARDGATLSDVRLDRDHWAFDPVAYRRARLAMLIQPRAVSQACLFGAGGCAIITLVSLVAVSL